MPQEGMLVQIDGNLLAVDDATGIVGPQEDTRGYWCLRYARSLRSQGVNRETLSRWKSSSDLTSTHKIVEWIPSKHPGLNCS